MAKYHGIDNKWTLRKDRNIKAFKKHLDRNPVDVYTKQGKPHKAKGRYLYDNDRAKFMHLYEEWLTDLEIETGLH